MCVLLTVILNLQIDKIMLKHITMTVSCLTEFYLLHCISTPNCQNHGFIFYEIDCLCQQIKDVISVTKIGIVKPYKESEVRSHSSDDTL